MKPRTPKINTRAPARIAVEAIMLRREEAAAALGISVDAFDDHVRPYLPSVKVGRLNLYRHADIERWAEESVQRPPVERLLA